MRLLYAAILAASVAACAPVNTASTYTEAQLGRAATVMRGKVIAVRPVTIQGDSSGGGALAGAAAGGAAGTMVSGNPALMVAGAAGGALIGGVAGAVTEEAMRRGGGVELIVEQENGQIVAVVQTNEEGLKSGDKVLLLRSDRVRVIKDGTEPAAAN